METATEYAPTPPKSVDPAPDGRLPRGERSELRRLEEFAGGKNMSSEVSVAKERETQRTQSSQR